MIWYSISKTDDCEGGVNKHRYDIASRHKHHPLDLRLNRTRFCKNTLSEIESCQEMQAGAQHASMQGDQSVKASAHWQRK